MPLWVTQNILQFSFDKLKFWEYNPKYMEAKLARSLQAAVARLLKPLVRMMLRHGVPFGAFMDVARRVYVDVAMEEFTIPGRKPTISRASVITGLSRKEILRVRRLPPLSDEGVSTSYNRATRVIGGWVRDEAFAEKPGVPAALPMEGRGRSFTRLVRKYSGDVPPRAILDELLRVGAVEREAKGRIRLCARGYVPSAGEEEKLGILGADVADLIDTIDHNLRAPGGTSRLQMKVAYDNLPGEPLRRFRSRSSKQSLKLLEKFDKELAGMDRDVTADSRGTGRLRAGVAIYYFEEDLSDQGSGDSA